MCPKDHHRIFYVETTIRRYSSRCIKYDELYNFTTDLIPLLISKLIVDRFTLVIKLYCVASFYISVCSIIMFYSVDEILRTS